LSRHPKKRPGVWHTDVTVVVDKDVDVLVGRIGVALAGTLGTIVVVVRVNVVELLHPNQPGFAHEVVVIVVV